MKAAATHVMRQKVAAGTMDRITSGGNPVIVRMNIMSIKDLNAKRAVLEEMSVDSLKAPRAIPVEIYIREAEKLHNVCREDLEKLKAIGFNVTLLDDLQVRIGALRKAESFWLAYRYNREEARMLWDLHSVEGYELRDRLLATLRFAYRDDVVLTGRLKVVSAGQGHADLVQDLSHLETLGQSSPELLQLINFDFALLERAAHMSSFLGDILGRFDADSDKHQAVKVLRDAAYTHLNEAVKVICTYGRFIFRKNRKKRGRYYSNYLRKKRRETYRKAKKQKQLEEAAIL